jgi:hypothetical protein
MTPMVLTCFEIAPGRVELRPAPRRREWMDETPRAFAYHCLPLVTANQHGWEMLCPVDVTLKWSGGAGLADVEITVDGGDARHSGFVESHFGSGIVTFNPMVILRSPPGFNLWLSGPVNLIKDGIQPLSASIEADWMPFTFSMNWKLTRPDFAIRFVKGEPFCSFFPVQRGVVAACEPRLLPLERDAELHELYRWAIARRGLDELLGSREREAYQSWYRDGEMPKRAVGRAPDDHETNIAAKPFTRDE